MLTDDQFGVNAMIDMGTRPRSGSTRVAPEKAQQDSGPAATTSFRPKPRASTHLGMPTSAYMPLPVLVVDAQTAQRNRGMVWQLFVQVRGVFVETLRRQHILFSIFMAKGDAQVLLTLPQRVMVRVHG